MQISKERLRLMIEYAFKSGMIVGYGIDHTNIKIEEDIACKEFLETIEELK